MHNMSKISLNKFVKDDFGSLTTITNPKTGNTVFIAKEVGEMWGHTNMTSVTKRLLNSDELMILKKSEHIDFFDILVDNKILSTRAQRIQLLTESGLYKMALSSNLEKAKPFKDWVTSEVLPSIRKNGYYSIADNLKQIALHTDETYQKKNSIDVNAKNCVKGGIYEVINYNRKSCLVHSDMTTKVVKGIGENIGMKGKSAKEVLRKIRPAVACSMSFTDDMVNRGFDFDTASQLSKKCAIPLFDGMLKLGMVPAELKD